MLLNQGEIEAIKLKIANNEQPWASAYSELISTANSNLSFPLQSVTDNGGGQSAGSHFLATDISCDSGSPDRSDYSKALSAGQAIRNLALAYALSGNTNYADKAVQLIYHWTINPSAYMEPTIDNKGPEKTGCASGGDIEILISIPAFMYGADLLWNYPGWPSAQRDGFNAWAAAFASGASSVDFCGAANPVPPEVTECVRSDGYCPAGCTFSSPDYDCNCNNWENWRQVLAASAAVITGDTNVLEAEYARLQETLAFQLDSQGRKLYDYTRTTGLSYSLFGVEPWIYFAEIAKHQGTNLYDLTVIDNGVEKNLELALDFLAPFMSAINPVSAWQAAGYSQTSPHNANESVGVFELAYAVYGKPQYLSAATNSYWGGRPHYSIWTGGPTTLTHAKSTGSSGSSSSSSSLSSSSSSSSSTSSSGLLLIIRSSDPPSGYIDPRQDRDAATNEVQGISSVSVTFSEAVTSTSGGSLGSGNFEIRCVKNHQDASDLDTGLIPVVTGVSGTGAGPYTLQLSSRLCLGAWTEIKAVDVVNSSRLLLSQSANRVILGFLPMDITQDGGVFGDDIIRWIQINNDNYDPAPLNKLQLLDQQRNGVLGSEDITRAIQLINGLGTKQAWADFYLGPHPQD